MLRAFPSTTILSILYSTLLIRQLICVHFCFVVLVSVCSGAGCLPDLNPGCVEGRDFARPQPPQQVEITGCSQKSQLLHQPSFGVSSLLRGSSMASGRPGASRSSWRRSRLPARRSARCAIAEWFSSKFVKIHILLYTSSLH